MAQPARSPEDAVTDIQVEIIIESGPLTAAETAAVTAVLTAAVREESTPAPRESAAIDQWRISQRHVRRPIVPGPGAWQSRLANS